MLYKKWFFILIVLLSTVSSRLMAGENLFVTSDIVSMDRIGTSNAFFVGGYRGFLGIIQITAEGAIFKRIAAPLTLDALVIKALSADQAIIGTSRGEIFRLENNQLNHIVSLSKFNDPIMDMAIKGDEVWVVAPRGLVAHSIDRGKSWTPVVINHVKKQVTLGSTEAVTWNLGASNIDPESIVFSPMVDGKKAVDDEDYYFNADSGSLEIVNPLDESSNLNVSFNYRPGPQYQAGDVSLNTVSFFGDSVLIAGEFGTVIVLGEDGQWTSIYQDVRRNDSNMPYWIESAVVGENISLVGAGGVAMMTVDAGQQWTKFYMENDNGIFDVSIINDHDLLAAGAVGTAAINRNNQWIIADRSRLGLIAWLKTIVKLDGDSFLIAGGRGTLVSYKNNKWKKLAIREVAQ